MKSDRASRRSVRYAIFICSLTCSIFSGSGAFADSVPAPIATIDELIAIGNTAESLSGNYYLSNSLTLSTPAAGTAYVTGIFTGIFDGKSLKILGLENPLFEDLGVGSKVQNLSLSSIPTGSDPEIGFSGEGLLAKSATGATVQDVHVEGSFITNSSSNVGGLIGLITDTTITGSSASVQILNSGNSDVGGLVGKAVNSSISNSNASGSVPGIQKVGGLVGESISSIIQNSHATATVSGEVKVGGLVGLSDDSDLTNVFSEGNVTATKESVGGLVGAELNESSISGSYFKGNVCLGTLSGSECSVPTFLTDGDFDYVGGLVGKIANSSVLNSYTRSKVTGVSSVGGLAGKISNSTIQNVFTDGSVIAKIEFGSTESTPYIPYWYWMLKVGGLSGEVLNSEIANSKNAASITSSSSFTFGNFDSGGGGDFYGSRIYVGGLFGNFQDSSMSNSQNSGNINVNANINIGSVIRGVVSGDGIYAGGLVGYMTNDSAIISNSTNLGNLTINANVAVESANIRGSFPTTYAGAYGTVINYGGLVALKSDFASLALSKYAGLLEASSSILCRTTCVTGAVEVDTAAILEIPSSFSLDISQNENVNFLRSLSSAYESTNTWGICSSINDGDPYLISSVSSDPCAVETGDDGTPPTPHRPIRERVEREVREVAESRAPEKIEKVIGFKNEAPLPKNSPISFVEATEKIDIAKVKAVEIAPTVNVKVSAKAGEALQISLKSESKESVELWVKSPDGSWLLAGVITFDKDGKAILPPLLFKNAGDYSLVLSKPSADSAKGSAPLNQTGSLLVAVS